MLPCTLGSENPGASIQSHDTERSDLHPSGQRCVPPPAITQSEIKHMLYSGIET